MELYSGKGGRRSVNGGEASRANGSSQLHSSGEIHSVILGGSDATGLTITVTEYIEAIRVGIV